MTDYPYKSKIEQAVKEHSNLFSIPAAGSREFLLQDRCKADFCFIMNPNGRLFIEDDDAMRGLGNLVKYWIWCEAHPLERPVHVIHILETSRSAAIKEIRFLGDKMQEQIIGFTYHMITIPNWQIADEDWLPQFRGILLRIVSFCDL